MVMAMKKHRKSAMIFAALLACLLAFSGCESGGKDSNTDSSDNSVESTDSGTVTDSGTAAPVIDGRTITLDKYDPEQIGKLDENGSIPADGSTIVFTGYSDKVTINLSAGSDISSIDVYGVTINAQNDEIRLYGNCFFDLWEDADSGAIIIEFTYYNVGYTYVVLPDGTIHTFAPEDDYSTVLFRDGEKLRWRRTNTWAAQSNQFGALCTATSRDELFTESGDAEIKDKEVILKDADSVKTVSEAFDLDEEFTKLGFSENYSSVDQVLWLNGVKRIGVERAAGETKSVTENSAILSSDDGWYYYEVMDKQPGFVKFDFDTENSQVTFTAGYQDSEYAFYYTGGYSFEDGVVKASLDDKLNAGKTAEMTFRVNYYGSGDAPECLDIEILSCSDSRVTDNFGDGRVLRAIDEWLPFDWNKTY